MRSVIERNKLDDKNRERETRCELEEIKDNRIKEMKRMVNEREYWKMRSKWKNELDDKNRQRERY